MRKLTIALLILTICGVRLEAQSCQLGSINQISFQQYSSATIQTTGSISVNCTSGTAYSIGLSAGASGSTAQRTMYCGACTPTKLIYQLFSNATYTTNWGNAPGTDTVPAIGTGSSQPYTINAQMPALQYFFTNGYGGNYTDSIIVTIICPTCTSISGNNQPLNVHLQQTAVGCGISANNLNFGLYTGVQLSATTTISVGCTGGTAYNVGLNAGAGAGASITTRKMTGPGATPLNYQMFRDSGYSANWGNTAGSDTAGGTGNNTIQTLTVYGLIPAGQHVAVGSYAVRLLRPSPIDRRSNETTMQTERSSSSTVLSAI
jgi:spore coat protein U-like protein